MNNREARLVIVAYKPKPGKETELLALVNEHVPFLRSLGLATERQHIVAAAIDGTVLEVFEWVEGAIEKAHRDPALAGMWERYAAVCEYVPLKTLNEAGMMFAGFAPLN